MVATAVGVQELREGRGYEVELFHLVTLGY
jgi:hypothetical protein